MSAAITSMLLSYVEDKFSITTFNYIIHKHDENCVFQTYVDQSKGYIFHS